MRNGKKRGCIGTFLLLPFYVIYFGIVICGSFLLGVLMLLWELVKLPFKCGKPLTGIEYEKRVADYLRLKGYWGVKVTQASGDYGVDITAHKHRKKYAIQCKYYSQPVGVSAVQEVVAGKSHYGCNAAMVVTNSTFTVAAERLAKENGVTLMEKIDFRKPQKKKGEKVKARTEVTQLPPMETCATKPAEPICYTDKTQLVKFFADNDFYASTENITKLCYCDTITTAKIQRTLAYGYARAAKVVDLLKENGYLVPAGSEFIYKWAK